MGKVLDAVIAAPYMTGRMTRKKRLLLIAAPVALFALYTGYWWTLAGRTTAMLDRWAEDRRALGWEVAYAPPRVSGFPGTVRIDVELPRIAKIDNGTSWEWRSPAIFGTLDPWAPGRVVVDLSDQHAVAIENAGRERAISVAADTAKLTVPFLAGAEPGILDASGISVVGTEIDSIETVFLRLSDPNAEAEAASATAPHLPRIRLRAELTGLRLHTPPQDFDPVIRHVVLDGTLAGRIRGGRRDAALRQWRDDGGTLEIRSLELDWSKVSIRADGTWALDKNLQPEGAMTAKLRGLTEILKTREKEDGRDGRGAWILRQALKAMESADGELTLPLTVQNQALSIGPFPLARLPKINWYRCRAPGECVVSLE